MVKHLRQIPLDTYKPLREVVIENIRDAILSGGFSRRDASDGTAAC